VVSAAAVEVPGARRAGRRRERKEHARGFTAAV
jgi:hypothetical protein